jgi:threonine synthase
MKPIRYISTREKAPALSFEDVVLAGMAPDGGLYVPNRIPAFSTAEIAGLQNMSYPELAYAIISRFTGESIEPEALERIVADTYKTFTHAAVAPLAQLDTHTFILELFHGPTLAFKDFALQFLGRLLAHILENKKQKAVIIGATSGDTGSAAIAGCRGYDSMEIFILHPKGKISDVQRRQMTTVQDKNVHNIAVEGTFDGCQAIVKELFADQKFRDKQNLTAVNSINWARIVAQVVYYFYAALALGAPARNVSFSVPTGNFGDIYAGHIAKKMGLPIDQLIIATNSNSILTRCLKSGVYDIQDVVATISPSMDIQVSSNFERLLFDYYDGDAKAVAKLMEELKKKKRFTLAPQVLRRFQAEFASDSVGDMDTLDAILEAYRATGNLMDPHTAVGYVAGSRCRAKTETPLVVLATAHPAKFLGAVKEATGLKPALPEAFSDLMRKKERFDVLPDETRVVRDYIEKHNSR